MDFYKILTTYKYLYDNIKADKLLKERSIDMEILVEKLKKYDICAVLPNPNYEK